MDSGSICVKIKTAELKRLCWKLPPCRYTENFSQSSLKEYLEAGWNVVDISWVPLYIAGDHFTTQTVFELFNLFRVRAKKQRKLPFCLDFVHFPSCFVPSLSCQSAIVRHTSNRNVRNTRRLVCVCVLARRRAPSSTATRRPTSNTGFQAVSRRQSEQSCPPGQQNNQMSSG